MPVEIILIKQKAHAFSMASVCCLILSVPACFGLASKDVGVRTVSMAAVTVEVLLIVAAVYFWIRETPEEIRREVAQ